MADVEHATPGVAEGSTSCDVEVLREALAASRADAKARGEQLELAKEKAKAVVRAQMERARAAEARLQEHAKIQELEIEQLNKRIKELENLQIKMPNGSAIATTGATKESQNDAKAPADRISWLRERILELAEQTTELEGNAVAGDQPQDGVATQERANGDNLDSTESERETSQVLPAIAKELMDVEEAVRGLADDFLAAQTAAKILQDDVRAQTAGSSKALAEARADVQSFQSRVVALQAANKANSAVESADLKAALDAKAVLEAKLSSMDALLTEKADEVAKVREKAREFLKNMSADKKAMELRMKEEISVLKQKSDMLEGKAAASEQHALTLDSELENCLALVSEKQKTIQMLNMALSTERESTANANREIASVMAEFANYKERARVALEDRDARLEKSDSAVQVATEGLRSKLLDLSKALENTQTELAEAHKNSADANHLLDRAVRAEAALELEVSHTAAESSMHAGKIKQLEESVEQAKQLIAETEVRAENAEERSSTLTERVEIAMKDVAAAEARLVEQEKAAESESSRLREKIALLEASLHKSVESASAAQRVAAVAARALGESSPQTNSQNSNGGMSSIRRSSTLEEAHRSRLSSEDGLAQIGSSSLAAVMSSHSLSLGLTSPRKGAELSQEEVDNSFRDQQMAVLTSQLSELGTLLDDAQEESKARAMQTDLLKQEIRELEAKLAAAEKLQNGAPFSYLRSIVLRYLETKDTRLLPVLGDVLSISKDELQKIRDGGTSSIASGGQQNGFFSIPFLGRR